MIDWRAIGMAFQKMVQVVCFCAIPPLLWALFIAWLHERDIHPFRKACCVFRRPLLELMIILSLVGAAIHTGATKRGGQGEPGGLRQSPPAMEATPSGEILEPVQASDPLPAYTNAITNLCFTGILPTTNSVFLGIGGPTNDVPPFVDIYAKHDLVTNGWSAVAAVEFPAGENQFTVELPYSLLPGGWGSSMFFMLGSSIDTDGDGLTDAFERLVAKTDPASADTDGDGMPDGWEYAFGLDPLSDVESNGADYDADGDGLSNLDELMFGTHPQNDDSDGDGAKDGIEIGYVEELVGDDFLWLDTQSCSNICQNVSSYDYLRTRIALPFGTDINGVCYTNAMFDLDGLVTLQNPTNDASGIGSGYRHNGGMSNYLWSASHVTIAAYNEDLYAKPRSNDWGSEIRCGGVAVDGKSYNVIECRNISHYDFRSSNDLFMAYQVILPKHETNTVYVSYLSVADAITTLPRTPVFGVQLPATNCVPGRGQYGNVGWCRRSDSFTRPFTLKYHLGTATPPADADIDGDGIFDPIEVFIHHTDPFRADTDGDGLADNVEIDYGTDPNDSDTDDDGLPDGWEVGNETDPFVHDAEHDPDGDGLANIWEWKNGTDPKAYDTDGDGLPDSREAGWIESGVTNIPWFAFTPILSAAPMSNVDNAMYVCELPFVNSLAGSVFNLVVADVNGVVYFGSSETTNGINSTHSTRDLSQWNSRLQSSLVAGYWADLQMRAALGSAISFGVAENGTNRYFVIEYNRVGFYNGSGNEVTFQIAIPELQQDVVYVRYGSIVDGRSTGNVSIGAQGAEKEGFGNSPMLSCYYRQNPPVISNGTTIAFHFGTGGNPLVADTDGDGLDDRIEAQIRTDPRNTDTDGDGFSDWDEIGYGMSPLSAVGADGADGDLDGDGLSNVREIALGTNLMIADTDGDGIPDGAETGHISVSNALPWLEFDASEDITETISTNARRCVSRQMPCPLLIQGYRVPNVTISANGIVYLNRAGYANPGRTTSGSAFQYAIDANTIAIAPYLDYLYLRSDIPGFETSIRFGTATHNGVGYILTEYENLFSDNRASETNAISFQLAIPTNAQGVAYASYRNLTSRNMDGRDADIGMQTFDGRWLHPYKLNSSAKVYEGLSLAFVYGENTDPLDVDSDGDGLNDGEELSAGTIPSVVDTDGDGMPDGWEHVHGLNPTSAYGGDGALGDGDGDALPNLLEYELETDPSLPDTDGDGLRDGEEVVSIYESSELPWQTLADPNDITSSFSNYWECVNFTLPAPLEVQGRAVTNLTVDANGVVYFDRAGHANGMWASSGQSLEYEIDDESFVVAPYWSSLSFTNIVGASSIRIGTATVGTNGWYVIEYANMYRHPEYGETNMVSFQLSFPTGRVDRFCVRYSNLAGEDVDGSRAVIGMQTFGFCDYRQYCYYERGKVSEGKGLTFLVGYGSSPLFADTDRDGLSDGVEVNSIGSNPNAKDTDGDGLDDQTEISLGTNPLSIDSDNDGLNDGWEVSNGLDPLSATGDDGANGDLDEDGVSNLDEQILGTDPQAEDSDEDGLLDGDEIARNTNPTLSDTDGDGLSDGDEVTRNTNPLSADSDQDGLADGWEVSNGFDPLVPHASGLDTDQDGLSDLQEQSLGTNPAMSDTDGDLLSDLFEVNESHTDPNKSDTDGDGIPDKVELDRELNPLRVDSDHDGLPDGWETSYGLNPSNTNGVDGADGDIDGDGLSNIDEYRSNCNPRMKDSDGDGVNDNIEVANGSDPADASDGGVQPDAEQFREINFNITGDWAAWEMTIEGLGPDDTRIRRITMGAPASPASTTERLRKNSSYRLSMKWLNCDGHDDHPDAPWYCWQALVDSKPSVQTFNDYSSARKDGVARIIVGNGWIAENEDGLLTAHVHEHSHSSGNVAEGRTALLHVFDIEHDLLWETENKCNQIRNDTPKDDSSGNFPVEIITLGGKKCSFAAHRNFLYAAAATDNKIRVTERVKVADSMRNIIEKYSDLFLIAAFKDGEVVAGSQSQIFSDGDAAAMEIRASSEATVEEFQLRVGIDADGDGELSYEESSPLEVCKIREAPAYATVKGISKSMYEKHHNEINNKVYFMGDNPPDMIAPHARSFLKLFYEPGSQNGLESSLRPTGQSTVQIDAFSQDGSCFAEWLTHNCGANFSDSGVATINRYVWDEFSAVSRFMAQRTPFELKSSMIVGGNYCEFLTDTGSSLLAFYNGNVKAAAEEALRDAEDGAEITLPLNNGWYGMTALTNSGVFKSLSPYWVPGLTLNVGSSSDYGGWDALLTQVVTANPAFNDFDAFGTIGRGRILNPRYRFAVKKVVPWIGPVRYEVKSVQFECAIEDLYDFNYEDGKLPAHAAALQIGYRDAGRSNGMIYTHHIDISTSYSYPFTYFNSYSMP